MVKIQKYLEAAEMKKKLKILEEKNEDTNTKREIYKRENKFIQLTKKHETELFALEKKIKIGKKEMIKAREKDFESIHLKFKVLKEKNEKKQRKKRLSEEKRLKRFRPCSKYMIRTDC